MYPPTPTPLPYLTPHLNVEYSDFGMWANAPMMIQAWNYRDSVGDFFQIIIILIMVVVFVGTMIYMLQDIMDKDL